jgi:hypothetical protein
MMALVINEGITLREAYYTVVRSVVKKLDWRMGMEEYRANTKFSGLDQSLLPIWDFGGK